MIASPVALGGETPLSVEAFDAEPGADDGGNPDAAAVIAFGDHLLRNLVSAGGIRRDAARQDTMRTQVHAFAKHQVDTEDAMTLETTQTAFQRISFQLLSQALRYTDDPNVGITTADIRGFITAAVDGLTEEEFPAEFREEAGVARFAKEFRALVESLRPVRPVILDVVADVEDDGYDAAITDVHNPAIADAHEPSIHIVNSAPAADGIVDTICEDAFMTGLFNSTPAQLRTLPTTLEQKMLAAAGLDQNTDALYIAPISLGIQQLVTAFQQEMQYMTVAEKTPLRAFLKRSLSLILHNLVRFATTNPDDVPQALNDILNADKELSMLGRSLVPPIAGLKAPPDPARDIFAEIVGNPCLTALKTFVEIEYMQQLPARINAAQVSGVFVRGADFDALHNVAADAIADNTTTLLELLRDALNAHNITGWTASDAGDRQAQMLMQNPAIRRYFKTMVDVIKRMTDPDGAAKMAICKKVVANILVEMIMQIQQGNPLNAGAFLGIINSLTEGDDNADLRTALKPLFDTVDAPDAASPEFIGFFNAIKALVSPAINHIASSAAGLPGDQIVGIAATDDGAQFNLALQATLETAVGFDPGALAVLSNGAPSLIEDLRLIIDPARQAVASVDAPQKTVAQTAMQNVLQHIMEEITRAARTGNTIDMIALNAEIIRLVTAANLDETVANVTAAKEAILQLAKDPANLTKIATEIRLARIGHDLVALYEVDGGAAGSQGLVDDYLARTIRLSAGLPDDIGIDIAAYRAYVLGQIAGLPADGDRPAAVADLNTAIHTSLSRLTASLANPARQEVAVDQESLRPLYTALWSSQPMLSRRIATGVMDVADLAPLASPAHTTAQAIATSLQPVIDKHGFYTHADLEHGVGFRAFAEAVVAVRTFIGTKSLAEQAVANIVLNEVVTQVVTIMQADGDINAASFVDIATKLQSLQDQGFPQEILDEIRKLFIGDGLDLVKELKKDYVIAKKSIDFASTRITEHDLKQPLDPAQPTDVEINGLVDVINQSLGLQDGTVVEAAIIPADFKTAIQNAFAEIREEEPSTTTDKTALSRIVSALVTRAIQYARAGLDIIPEDFIQNVFNDIDGAVPDEIKDITNWLPSFQELVTNLTGHLRSTDAIRALGYAVDAETVAVTDAHVDATQEAIFKSETLATYPIEAQGILAADSVVPEEILRQSVLGIETSIEALPALPVSYTGNMTALFAKLKDLLDYDDLSLANRSQIQAYARRALAVITQAAQDLAALPRLNEGDDAAEATRIKTALRDALAGDQVLTQIAAKLAGTPAANINTLFSTQFICDADADGFSATAFSELVTTLRPVLSARKPVKAFGDGIVKVDDTYPVVINFAEFRGQLRDQLFPDTAADHHTLERGFFDANPAITNYMNLLLQALAGEGAVEVPAGGISREIALGLRAILTEANLCAAIDPAREVGFAVVATRLRAILGDPVDAADPERAVKDRLLSLATEDHLQPLLLEFTAALRAIHHAPAILGAMAAQGGPPPDGGYPPPPPGGPGAGQLTPATFRTSLASVTGLPTAALARHDHIVGSAVTAYFGLITTARDAVAVTPEADREHYRQAMEQTLSYLLTQVTLAARTGQLDTVAIQTALADQFADTAARPAVLAALQALASPAALRKLATALSVGVMVQDSLISDEVVGDGAPPADRSVSRHLKQTLMLASGFAGEDTVFDIAEARLAAYAGLIDTAATAVRATRPDAVSSPNADAVTTLHKATQIAFAEFLRVTSGVEDVDEGLELADIPADLADGVQAACEALVAPANVTQLVKPDDVAEQEIYKMSVATTAADKAVSLVHVAGAGADQLITTTATICQAIATELKAAFGISQGINLAESPGLRDFAQHLATQLITISGQAPVQQAGSLAKLQRTAKIAFAEIARSTAALGITADNLLAEDQVTIAPLATGLHRERKFFDATHTFVEASCTAALVVAVPDRDTIRDSLIAALNTPLLLPPVTDPARNIQINPAVPAVPPFIIEGIDDAAIQAALSTALNAMIDTFRQALTEAYRIGGDQAQMQALLKPAFGIVLSEIMRKVRIGETLTGANIQAILNRDRVLAAEPVALRAHLTNPATWSAATRLTTELREMLAPPAADEVDDFVAAEVTNVIAPEAVDPVALLQRPYTCYAPGTYISTHLAAIAGLDLTRPVVAIVTNAPHDLIPMAFSGLRDSIRTALAHNGGHGLLPETALNLDNLTFMVAKLTQRISHIITAAGASARQQRAAHAVLKRALAFILSNASALADPTADRGALLMADPRITSIVGIVGAAGFDPVVSGFMGVNPGPPISAAAAAPGTVIGEVLGFLRHDDEYAQLDAQAVNGGDPDAAVDFDAVGDFGARVSHILDVQTFVGTFAEGIAGYTTELGLDPMQTRERAKALLDSFADQFLAPVDESQKEMIKANPAMLEFMIRFANAATPVDGHPNQVQVKALIKSIFVEVLIAAKLQSHPDITALQRVTVGLPAPLTRLFTEPHNAELLSEFTKNIQLVLSHNSKVESLSRQLVGLDADDNPVAAAELPAFTRSLEGLIGLPANALETAAFDVDPADVAADRGVIAAYKLAIDAAILTADDIPKKQQLAVALSAILSNVISAVRTGSFDVSTLVLNLEGKLAAVADPILADSLRKLINPALLRSLASAISFAMLAKDVVAIPIDGEIDPVFESRVIRPQLQKALQLATGHSIPLPEIEDYSALINTAATAVRHAGEEVRPDLFRALQRAMTAMANSSYHSKAVDQERDQLAPFPPLPEDASDQRVAAYDAFNQLLSMANINQLVASPAMGAAAITKAADSMFTLESTEALPADQETDLANKISDALATTLQLPATILANTPAVKAMASACRQLFLSPIDQFKARAVLQKAFHKMLVEIGRVGDIEAIDVANLLSDEDIVALGLDPTPNELIPFTGIDLAIKLYAERQIPLTLTAIAGRIVEEAEDVEAGAEMLFTQTLKPPLVDPGITADELAGLGASWTDFEAQVVRAYQGMAAHGQDGQDFAATRPIFIQALTIVATEIINAARADLVLDGVAIRAKFDACGFLGGPFVDALKNPDTWIVVAAPLATALGAKIHGREVELEDVGFELLDEDGAVPLLGAAAGHLADVPPVIRPGIQDLYDRINAIAGDVDLAGGLTEEQITDFEAELVAFNDAEDLSVAERARLGQIENLLRDDASEEEFDEESDEEEG
jgi:hypothetical protein